MASATLDVVLAMESKLRDNVKSDALRWNATSQQFERFDGSAWAACVDVPSDVVHKAGAETITGAKTFSAGIVGDLTGDVTGNVTGNCSGSSGSCAGNAATATALATARSLQTSLASGTAASFDGSADASIGVTGVLPVANGGTGQTSLSNVTVGNATVAASCTGNSATATQATQDGSGNVIASTYLPLSGGTMTGPICCNSTMRIIKGYSGGSVVVDGSPSGKGAHLTLHDGTDSGYPGEFLLWAINSEATLMPYLRGTPSGYLQWGGKEIERVNSSGSNYIRYENGLQICWHVSLGPASGNHTVSFPVAFSATPTGSICKYANSSGIWFNSMTTTNFSFYAADTMTATALFIGWWK